MSTAAHRFDCEKRYRDDGHDRQRMLTPSYVLEPVRELLGGIDLDPCTESDNPTGAERFYCLPDDGCAMPWSGRVFVNPPYAKAKERWVRKCIDAAAAGAKVVLLIPCHTDTRIAQLALERCDSVVFIRSRLRFKAVRKNGRHEAASHGSMLIGFNVDLSPLKNLGVVFRK